MFLDFKKAFDTVDHRILLRKLYAYGIRGNILKWFESYLTDRSQYVAYCGVESKVLPIICGVPQGSILGPLLFIIYMDDICNVSHLGTILYADDTSVVANDKNLDKLLQILNDELHKLSIWLKANKLSLNINKTYYILFHRARIKLPDVYLNIYMNNCTLTGTECYKYLSVILDSKMSWVQHITYVKSKVSKGIGIMYQACKYLDKNSLINLYNNYIYPYLIYCVESWGNISKCHLDPLFILQKKILRIITFSWYDVSSQILFMDVNILPLYNLIQHRISFMMYKLVNGLFPEVMNELYTTNDQIHDHFTRQYHFFHINKGRSNVYTRSFGNISPRIWNAVQTKIDVNVSIVKFKSMSKLYFMEHKLEIIYTK